MKPLKASSLTVKIKSELLAQGVVLADIGDLTELPPEVRGGLPVGICVAVKYPKEVIRGIAKLPTREYLDWYNSLNNQLDELVTFGAELLHTEGYRAIAQTRAQVGTGDILSTALPHKTVATRSGTGWIGKSALLVTEKFGSMIRISSILTDAPLETAIPINISKCANCMICADACPAQAISGKAWSVEMFRDEFFNPIACRKTAKERSKKGFNSEATICGKCIEVCPYTRKYIGSDIGRL
jgi:epoxyqueuosine reductase QueG